MSQSYTLIFRWRDRAVEAPQSPPPPPPYQQGKWVPIQSGSVTAAATVEDSTPMSPRRQRKSRAVAIKRIPARTKMSRTRTSQSRVRQPNHEPEDDTETQVSFLTNETIHLYLTDDGSRWIGLVGNSQN